MIGGLDHQREMVFKVNVWGGGPRGSKGEGLYGVGCSKDPVERSFRGFVAPGPGVLGPRGSKSKGLHGIGPEIDHQRGISPRSRAGVLEDPKERDLMIN